MSTSCKSEHNVKALSLTWAVPAGISTKTRSLFRPDRWSAAWMKFLKRTRVKTWGFLKADLPRGLKGWGGYKALKGFPVKDVMDMRGIGRNACLRFPHRVVRLQNFRGLSYQACTVTSWQPQSSMVQDLGHGAAGLHLDLCGGSIGTANDHLHRAGALGMASKRNTLSALPPWSSWPILSPNICNVDRNLSP